MLNKFASAFKGLEVQDLTEGESRRRGSEPLRYEENPKPVRLGHVVLENVFLLIGNHTKPLDFSVRISAHPDKSLLNLSSSSSTEMISPVRAQESHTICTKARFLMLFGLLSRGIAATNFLKSSSLATRGMLNSFL